MTVESIYFLRCPRHDGVHGNYHRRTKKDSTGGLSSLDMTHYPLQTDRQTSPVHSTAYCHPNHNNTIHIHIHHDGQQQETQGHIVLMTTRTVGWETRQTSSCHCHWCGYFWFGMCPRVAATSIRCSSSRGTSSCGGKSPWM